MGLTRPRAEQIYNLDYKQATRVVTVTNVVLSGGAPATVDGVSLATNDRVLVTGQTTASQNGIYDVATVGTGSNGTWVRTPDANATGEILAGMIVMVTEGVIYADTQWKLITDNPIVIGTTTLVFTQNYSANSISGGTSNVTVYANANITISSVGTPNVLIVSSTGTVTSGTASITGNITGGNILTVGQISATGNITGGYILGNGSQLTGIAGSTYGNSNVTALLSAFGSNSISTTGNITAANLNSSNADLAEMYCADNNYAPGTVVEFGGKHEITATKTSHSTRVAGIISTSPSYLMNSTLICEKNALEVALIGRVPCQVVGIIAKGDRLVSSTITGVATALDKELYEPGCIIGKALEEYQSANVGVIEVAVGRF
jgi:hypothetical protein